MLPSSEIPYIIYNYVPESQTPIDRYEAPWLINFCTGLSIGLNRNELRTLGRKDGAIYYAEYDPETREYSIPVVRQDRELVIADGLLQGYTPVFSFYLENGELGPHPKRMNYYNLDLNQQIKEIEEKRAYQASKAAEVAVGALMKMGESPSDAMAKGSAYWRSLGERGLIREYTENRPETLREAVASDTSPSWLPAIREALLAELA